MRKKENVRVESDFDLEEAVSYLSGIVTNLRDGRVTVEHAEHTLTLEPRGPVAVKIKASRKPGKDSIAIKIAWKTAHDNAADKKNETTDAEE